MAKKLKYFYCPVCNKTEIQEWTVAAVQHSHKGKLITCERVLNEKGEKAAKAHGKGVDKKESTSRLVDGLTGKPII